MIDRLNKSPLTHKRLVEVLDYNQFTGVFTWKIQTGKARVGSEAGVISLGYVRIGIDGHRYLAHHLAWHFVTGSWPASILDHRDGDGTNNVFANLRISTRTQNNQNCRAKSGSLKGTQLHRTGKFAAKITVNKKQIYLGLFSTEIEAHEAYQRAALTHFGEFARS